MRPKADWFESPHFTPAKDRKIKCVVLHATATSGIGSPLQWFTDPGSKVSAHYVIDKDGRIVQMVTEKNIAWHAGVSSWKGLEVKSPRSGEPSLNPTSIGIELVNPNDGYYPYPEEQLAACADLVTSICKDFRISAENVIGHADIALGRKTDPAAFPWEEFRERLRAGGVS